MNSSNPNDRTESESGLPQSRSTAPETAGSQELAPLKLDDGTSSVSVERDNAPGYRPKLPDWGVFASWPEAGVDWIHPEDVELARTMIPSKRVFKRVDWDENYYTFLYGDCRLRLKPTLWNRLDHKLDLEVGQQVELLARLGKNDPGLFRIAGIFFDQKTGQISFHLQRDDLILQREFYREDIRPVHVRHHLRTGFYKHSPPKQVPVDGEDRIDVGDLG